MNLWLKGGRIIDPARNLDRIGDLWVEGEKIVPGPAGPGNGTAPSGDGARDLEVMDLRGMIVVPGLIDMHTHLREPGFEYKETIASGSEAAVAGGFTSIACMPNTHPVNDSPAVTELIRTKAAACRLANVYPIAAITLKSEGAQLCGFRELTESGAVGFSDDGKPVMNARLMRRALECAADLDRPVIAHSEDLNLAAGGVMNEGSVAADLGLPGVPGISEEVMIARDLILAEFTGGPLHVAHVSTAGSVRLIRAAKERGVRVTAETAPHYFLLTDEAVRVSGTLAKVNPPLRSAADRAAIREGLRDGTLDAIATDHAPHSQTDKEAEFGAAASGFTGLETSLGLCLRLVADGVLTLPSLIERMTIQPARILRIAKGTLAPGADADITVIDPGQEWTVDRTLFRSRGKNSPFDRWALKGRAILTIVGGEIRYRNG